MSGYGPAVSSAVTTHVGDPVVGVDGEVGLEEELEAELEPTQPASAPKGDAASATPIA